MQYYESGMNALWNLIGWPVRYVRDTTTAMDSGTAFSPALYALVIGIDRYKSDDIPDLTGATSDADALVDYLRNDLHVPTEHIVNLRNEEATRAAIIQEIRAFSTRDGIRQGDPILIYFAGHGTSTVAPEDWHVGNRSISLIVPHDTDTKLDRAQTTDFAIPDRTIGALLHKLAEGEGSIGDNITVIFDCCHSGSGTRDFTPSHLADSRRARGFKADVILPSSLDHDILDGVARARGVKVCDGFSHAGAKSHVLLAACRETESAYEDNKRGYFTRELLRTLRSVRPNMVTYKDIMQRISNIPGQTPQCEGHNVDRVLFNARVVGSGHTIYEVRSLKEKNTFIVDAGSINGVVEETTFSVHASQDIKHDTRAVTVLKPTKVHAFRSELTYLGDTTSNIQAKLRGGHRHFAVQDSTGEVAALRLYVERADCNQQCIRTAVEKVAQTHRFSGGPAIVFANDSEQAHLGARATEGNVVYDIHDPCIVGRGLRQLRDTTKAEADAVQPVLRAATHFFWHLHHAPRKNALNQNIAIQVFQLEPDEDAKLGADLRYPWRAHGQDLYNGGVVDVVADGDTPYGIRVWNDFDVPLHVWAFYFDCGALSIAEYYKPPVAGRNAEAPLPGRRSSAGAKVADGDLTSSNGAYIKGKLTIGYGTSGGLPHTFSLHEGQDFDVGFIKLYISTEPVDLSGIVQRSPFGSATPRDLGTKDSLAALWDTVTIAVMQRRPV